MKLEKVTREVESIGFDDNESIVASIDVEDLSFIFRNLTDIYSRPIDSICREITSNGYDSHLRANVDKPIIVGFDKDADYQDYIYFKDNGIGLSHEEMKTIYMKYGKSKGRFEEKSMGNFGIGSKSPFSYRDDFHINCIKDGIKTEYVFYIGEDDMPRLDPLTSYETDEHNGVEVKIFLKDSFDKHHFINALNKELKYFDNVWFKNCEYASIEAKNGYQLYEYKTFKLRDDYVMANPNEELHICYGKASYNINFNKLKTWNSRIRIPIGLKIPMGLLRPTKNREDIIYDQKAIEVIDDAITDTMNELEALYSNQEEILTDLFEYQSKREIKGNIKIAEGVFLQTSDHFNTKKYKYHLDYKVPTSSELIFSNFFTVVFKIKDGRRLSKFNNTYALFATKLIRAKVNYKNDFLKNKFIKNGLIIRKNRKKLKTLYKDMTYMFGLEKLPYRERKEKVRMIYKDVFKQFTNISEAYSKIEVPQEFVEENKNQRNTLDKSKIIVYKMSDKPKKEWRYEITVKEIREYKGLIIYGTPDDEERLKIASEMFPSNNMMKKLNQKPYTFLYTSKTNQKYLIQLSLDNDHFINIDKFMDGRNRAFIKSATAFKLKKFIDKFTLRDIDDKRTLNRHSHHDLPQVDHYSAVKILKLLNMEMYLEYMKIHSYCKKAYLPTNKQFCEGMLLIAEKDNLLDKSIMGSYNILEEYMKDLDLIYYTYYTKESMTSIVLYARALKKKVNLKYYFIRNRDYYKELELEYNNKLNNLKIA